MLDGSKVIIDEPAAELSSKSKHLDPVLSTNLGLLFDTDCFNLFKMLKAESIDCIFADPPFNLGKDYGDGASKDDLDREEYLKWSYKWIDQCVRLIKPGGSVFIYILPQWGYHFATHLEKQRMNFRHWIALSMKGTFPRGRKLYPAHYALLYFTKGSPTTFNRVRLPIPKCRHCGKDIKDYGGHKKISKPSRFKSDRFLGRYGTCPSSEIQGAPAYQ